MFSAYKFAISYFLLFSLLLLISGAMLFEEKIGLSVSGVLKYYQGDESSFVQAKSTQGILKIILPHIFSFALFSMVLLHFLIFTPSKKTKKALFVVYLMFITAFIELVSPFCIIYGFTFFAYLKLLSFFLFQALVLYVSYLLLCNIIKL